MDSWKSVVENTFLVKNNKIKNIDVVKGPDFSGEFICLCDKSDIERQINNRHSIFARRPTPERVFIYRMLSKDPETALALMTRAVLGAWTLIRGKNSLCDLKEGKVFSLLNDHLLSRGEIVSDDILASSRQITIQHIKPAVEHAKLQEVVRKAHAQFVKQLAGRTVIIFGDSPLAT
jgi:hypothetical protein